jgi:hypothetical protein
MRLRFPTGVLRVAILPLRKDASIYLPEEAHPDVGEGESVAKLQSAELTPCYASELKPPAAVLPRRIRN